MTGPTDNLHPHLVELLEKLEVRLQQPLTITSGQRDPEKNAKVGGVKGSEHTYDPAEGVDVACLSGSLRYELVTAALEEGIDRIGIGKTFVHLGIAKDKPRRVIWHYYPTTTKEKP